MFARNSTAAFRLLPALTLAGAVVLLPGSVLAQSLVAPTAIASATPGPSPAAIASATPPVIASAVQVPVTLRSQSSVYDSHIRLGDVFDNVGTLGGTVIGQAPAAGRRASYDATALTRLARAFRLTWQPTSALDSVQVTRAATEVGADALRSLIAAALADDMARNGDGSRTEVQLDNRTASILLPQTAPSDQKGAEVAAIDSLTVRNLTFDSTTGSFNATVQARDPGAEVPPVQLTGRVMRMVRLPVVTRHIGSGEVITAADIDWVEVRHDRVTGDVATEERQLIGQAARRPLPSGQTVTLRDIQVPTVIAKGTTVTMTYRTATLQLTARGRALQDGAKGSVIQVLNTSSNRTVDATIEGPNLVSVNAMGFTTASR